MNTTANTTSDANQTLQPAEPLAPTCNKPTDYGTVADHIARILRDPATPHATIDAIVSIAKQPPTDKSDLNEPLVGIPFDVEVEVNRGRYERLAEHFAQLWEDEYLQVSGPEIPDNFRDDDGPNHPLLKGVSAHIDELVHNYCCLDMNPNAIRRFYAELRLWGDQYSLNMKRGQDLYKSEEKLTKTRKSLTTLETIVDLMRDDVAELEASLGPKV